MAFLLPWAMSAVTLAAIFAAGHKKPWAWLLSLGNQALWLAWIYLTWPTASGLLPMCLALIVLYARNHFLWSRSHAAAAMTSRQSPTTCANMPRRTTGR